MASTLIAISLNWLPFDVDLNTVRTWMVANAGSNFVAMQAGSYLEIFFSDDPGSAVASSIHTYWATLNDASSEATNYVSNDDRKATAAAAKATLVASATAKLTALGLTSDEIAAITGQ